MSWIVTSTELTESEFNDSITFPSYPLTPSLWRTQHQLRTGLQDVVKMPTYPLTPILWRVSENGLETGLFGEIPKPDDNWIISADGLKTKNMADPVYLGAFANNASLYSVTIPKTVKKIGRYAFYGTRLSYVKIARDCKYYPTSFPEGTVIDFYDEESDNNG